MNLLDFENFTVNAEFMHYAGEEHHYFIYNVEQGVLLTVSRLNDDDTTTDTRYSFGTLSTAIECIEEIENGNEV